jgi:serine/threonine-protein kinase
VLQAGVRLNDRYLLRQRLGAGGMGEVWLATDEVLGRTVAVKVMLPAVAADPDFARRFAAEATAMARVNHAAVASVHDFGRDRGVTFLVMEYIDGESLAQRLARDGRLTPADTMRLVAEVADGLQAVHDQGLVHRDIKPANLLVRRDGRVVITDFGIARHEDASRLTVSGAILGTPSYLSPEQVRGEPAGVRSDVYALGLVAYECLAGERPFVGDNPYAVALQRLQSAPRTIKIDSPARAVVERALAMDPADRWPSASALAGGARAAVAPPPPAAFAPPAGFVPPAGFPPAAGPLASGPPAAGYPPAAAAFPPGAPPGYPSAGAGVPPGYPSPGAGVQPYPVSPSQSAASGSRSRRLAALAAAVVVLAGVAAWSIYRASSSPAVTTPSAQTSGNAVVQAPEGFAVCDAAFCPAEPMCWGGLVATSGAAMPPARKECAEVHNWETFLAIPLPAGGVIITEDPLLDRPEIAAACSAATLAARSQDAGKTKDWVRDAWPIAVGGDSLLHCIARSPLGESVGGVVRS